MLKVFGIALVSIAISLYGAHLSSELFRAKKLREALYEFLLYIQNGISNGALPLDVLYASYKNPVLDKYGFLDRLKSGKAGALAYALSECELPLDKNMAELYQSLAASLGKSSHLLTEVSTLSRYIELIKTEEEKLRISEDTKRLLYRKLGVLCGLLAALIFL